MRCKWPAWDDETVSMEEMTMTRARGLSGDGAWSVILAGGEGERTRSFIEKWLGYHKPKQYCAFVGRRSLFQHTVDRADRMAPPQRRVAVVAEDHCDEVFDQLRGRTTPACGVKLKLGSPLGTGFVVASTSTLLS